MLLFRKMANCWERVLCSTPNRELNSLTPTSPSRRALRILIRKGWARALKNSAVKAESSGICTFEYLHILTLLVKQYLARTRRYSGGSLVFLNSVFWRLAKPPFSAACFVGFTGWSEPF